VGQPLDRRFRAGAHTDDGTLTILRLEVVVPVGRHAERRLTMPFFHNANWDARVECLVVDGGAPRHEPVSAGAHLMEMFRSTVTSPTP
jgi:isopenicillin N synthase-like dioxygenase